MCHEGPGDARVRSKGFIETVVNEKKRVKKGKKDKNAPVTLVRTSFHYHLKCYPYAKIKFKGAGHPCQVTGNPILEVRKLNSEMEVVQTWEAPPEALKPEKEKKKENKSDSRADSKADSKSDSKPDSKSDLKSGAKSSKKTSDSKQTVQQPAPTKSPDKNNNNIDSKQNGAGDAVEQMMKEMEIMESTSPTLSKSQKKRLKMAQKKEAKQEEVPETSVVPDLTEFSEPQLFSQKLTAEEPNSTENVEIEKLEEVDKPAPETEDVKFQDLTFQLGEVEMQRLNKENLYADKFNAISMKACELYYTASKFPELDEFFKMLILPEHENLRVFNRSPSKRFSKPKEIHLPSRELQNREVESRSSGPPGLTGSGPPGLPAQPLTPKSLSELLLSYLRKVYPQKSPVSIKMRISKHRKEMGIDVFDAISPEEHMANFSMAYDQEMAKDMINQEEAKRLKSVEEASNKENGKFFDTSLRPSNSPEDAKSAAPPGMSNSQKTNNSQNPFTTFNHNATTHTNQTNSNQASSTHNPSSPFSNNQATSSNNNNNNTNASNTPTRTQSHASIFNTNSQILSMDNSLHSSLRNKHKDKNTVVMTGLEAKFHRVEKSKSVAAEDDSVWKTVKSGNNNNSSNPAMNQSAWSKRTSLGSIDAAFGTSSIPTTVKSRYFYEEVSESGSEAGTLNVPETENDCIICLEEFTDADVIKPMECGHRFHSQCIDDWRKIGKDSSCPMCRKITLDPVEFPAMGAII